MSFFVQLVLVLAKCINLLIDFVGLLSINRLNLNANAAAKRSKLAKGSKKSLHTLRSQIAIVASDGKLSGNIINVGKTRQNVCQSAGL